MYPPYCYQGASDVAPYPQMKNESENLIFVVDDDPTLRILVERWLKREGYDVFLVLEATIGFNKRDESDDESEEVEQEQEPVEEPRKRRTGKIRLTSQDQKFLRALKISLDDESNK